MSKRTAYKCDKCGKEDIEPFRPSSFNVAEICKGVRFDIDLTSQVVTSTSSFTSDDHHVCKACVVQALKEWVEAQS